MYSRKEPVVVTSALTDLDRQSVLLLCSAFGQLGSQFIQPLSITEYNRLVSCLKNSNLRPADLLKEKNQDFWHTLNPQIDWERIFKLLSRGGLMGLVLERWQAQGLWTICRFEENYPAHLKRRLRDKTPPILYGIGEQSLLPQRGLAIVGSRNTDEDALEYAQRIGELCARDGLIVISGGAKGVDRAAMLGALHSGGQAIGVIPDSLLKAAVSSYFRPALSQRSLVLISPFDPETRWLASQAMQRNKYIYCLADAALVISSETDGGTWQGATEALKQYPNWQVPVYVRTEGSLPPGNTQLLTQGGIPFPISPWITPLTEMINNSEPPHHLPGKIPERQQLSLFESRSQTPPSPGNDSHLTQQPSPALTPDPVIVHIPIPRDIYSTVLPLILAELQTPKGLKELATNLDLKEIQAKVWLERAVQEGRIKLVKRKYTTTP